MYSNPSNVEEGHAHNYPRGKRNRDVRMSVKKSNNSWHKSTAAFFFWIGMESSLFSGRIILYVRGDLHAIIVHEPLGNASDLQTFTSEDDLL
eukprot:scaffold2627_cov140-Amphora_coffeaeformis.AAC.4